MTELNLEHAFRLALLALLVGSLSLYGWRASRRMAKSPGEYRRMLVRKGSARPVVLPWLRPESNDSIRSWGLFYSRLALLYAVFSFGIAGVLLALIIIDNLGMEAMVGPIAGFLSKFEAGLAC